MAVLHQLIQEPAPIRLYELLEKLGSNYTERSVRRWLTASKNSEINVELDIKPSSISIKILTIIVLALKAKKYLSRYNFPSTNEFHYLYGRLA
jgi:hypothetical protein